MGQLAEKLSENLAALDTMFGASADYYAKRITVCGCDGAIVLFDGERAETMVPAAMFIGLILRFESLRAAGRHRQLLSESVAKLLPMARKTGTLWEKETPDASCCHGFASVLAPLLAEAVRKRGMQQGSN